MPRLIVNPQSDQPSEVQLNPGSNYIGRSAENDVSVEDDSVSDLHCEVVVGSDSVLVRDLGSANGSWVDGEKIAEKALHSGQMLQLGSVEMLFEDDPVAQSMVETRTASSPSLAAQMRPGRSNSPPSAPPPQEIGSSAQPKSAPPQPPPIPGVVVAVPVVSQNFYCKYHPAVAARWHCPRCGHNYCDRCISGRMSPEGPLRLCTPCGVNCEPLQPDPKTLGDSEPDFLPAMLQSFTYPFQGDGWIIMALGSVFYGITGAMNHLGFAVLGVLSLTIFGSGYLLAYLMRIITSTANGEKHMPDWPDFGDWGDVIGPFLQGLAVVVACFVPLFIVGMWGAGDEIWAQGAALLLGGFYFPMAFLAVAMFDSVAALNPMLVVPSIARVLKEYLFACAVLLVIFVVRVLITYLFIKLTPLLFIGHLFSGFLGFYFVIVEMRILGALYRTRRHELGWFSNR